MATELAKAYVQIIPSARGIKGSITQALGGEASAAGYASGESFGGKLVSAFKGVLATAGIGQALAGALNVGAAMQQSIGGIETLFGAGGKSLEEYAAAMGKTVQQVAGEYDTLMTSQQLLMDNAAQAYRTAGLSANAYMETVTGFSASLLQSLSGDTVAAASIADMALTDMADNANKFGTGMELIQNAYQGFAKNNYTMLDNLKLGYGGTQAEMQRLLADAQKLTGVKYDISNLADVYTAVHVIQENLGIAGATAEEAASTFSGSFASMKAAATNLLGSLTLSQDIRPSLTALGETIFTFAGNLLPMTGNILQGLPVVFENAIDLSVQAMNTAANNTDALVSQGAALLSQLVSGIVSGAPYLLQSARNLMFSLGRSLLSYDWGTAATDLVTALRDNLLLAAGEILGVDSSLTDAISFSVKQGLPELLSQGVQTVLTLAGGILQGIPGLLATAGSIGSSLITVLMEALPGILQSGVDLIGALASGLLENLPAIYAAGYQTIASLLATVGSRLPDLLQSGITLTGELAAGAILAIPDVLAAAGQIIGDAAAAFLQFDWIGIGADIIGGIAQGVINAVGSLVAAVVEAAKAAFNAAKDWWDIRSPSRRARTELGQPIPAGMALGVEDNAHLVTDALEELSAESTQAAVTANLTQHVSIPHTVPTAPAADTSRPVSLTVNVYGAEGQDVRQLADLVADEIYQLFARKEAVFA